MADWNKRFMELAVHISTWSKYPGRKVGAVISDKRNNVVSVGYNGLPRRLDDSNESRYAVDVKYKWAEHAERNAIYNSERPLEGCRMHVPWFPCMDCARAIVQTGIKELVAIKPDFSDPDWGDDFRMALELFEEAGVYVRWYEEGVSREDK